LRPGENVGIGGDDTLFALTSGKVLFSGEGSRRRVSVVAATAE
jgi:large subunit ribosomal protein L27